MFVTHCDKTLIISSGSFLYSRTRCPRLILFLHQAWNQPGIRMEGPHYPWAGQDTELMCLCVQVESYSF